MKKIKRIGSFILALLLILSIQVPSTVFAAPAAAPVGEDTYAFEKGDILLYYVDMTSPKSIGSVSAIVEFDSYYLQLIQNSATFTPYLDREFPCPQDYTFYDNSVKFHISLHEDATDGMNFRNGNRLIQFEFKVLRDTNEIPEINLAINGATSYHGEQLIFAGLNFDPDTSWETTLQKTENGSIPLYTCDITLDKTHFVYDGTEKQPQVTVKHGAMTLIPGTDYIWLYDNNINIGTANVHVMSLGQTFIGTEVVNFTIGATDTPLPSVENCEIIMNQTSFVYNGQPHIPEIIVKDGDKVLNDGTDYFLAFTDNVNVGTCHVSICGFFNYCGSVTKSFEIIPAEKDKISISGANVAMDKTFSYTGSAIRPPMVVTLNGKELTAGTDYTVSYQNNIEPGTATVFIAGTGDYTDSLKVNFTIKAPEIKKVSLNDCTVTLDKSVFTYDGKAKEPGVTVKYGYTTLAKGTDYTVSYSNNINAGSGSVTITGMGNYTDSVTKTFSIQAPQKSEFTWGTDNWNFNNSAPKYFPKTTYREHISAEYLAALKTNLTNTEYYAVCESGSAWLDSQFGGSCYGMSSLTMLAKEGLFPFASYQSGATKLTDLAAPVDNKEVSSLVTYYQMLQVKDQAQQQYRTLPGRSHEENIKSILSTLDNNTLCLIGFKKAGWGGHAIVAYGYEYGSWTFNGVTYDGCIKICDPNRSISYDQDCHIYFNTKSYNWAIPLYSYVPITSTSGAVFNYVGANINDINYGGYLSGSSNNTTSDYVARIDANAISDNRTVSKVIGAEGIYMNQASSPGEIVEDYSYFAGGESKGTAGYNLYDSESAYKVVQDTPVELDLSIDYKDCLLTASSKAGTSVLFDNNGYVELKGDAADFSISMTYDDNYPTSWFTIDIDGSGASVATLTQKEDGYILSADNLKDISVKALNKETSATADFSTDYPSVYIYEINETTIGVKVDTDNNGTYETELETDSGDDILLGDVNLDGKLNIKDATAVQKHLASIATLDEKGLSVADFNKDSKVNIKDATAIQKKIAGLV